MNQSELQTRLARLGAYGGLIDGKPGPLHRAAVMKVLTDGPDTKLVADDYATSAKRLGVSPAHIRAIWTVEAGGSAFVDGRPTLLFEPHRFSRATQGRFDRTNPAVSYPTWNPRAYPATQAMRYLQLVEAVCLDVDAGFASASYGGPQILGENFAMCGFGSAFEFAVAMAQNERNQLLAFEAFVKAKGLHVALQAKDWAAFARGYNGSAFRENKYDRKLESAYLMAGGQ